MRCGILAVALLIVSMVARGDAISGHVLDVNDKPLPGARVFAEPGLAGGLMETRADADGAFRFDNVTADPAGAGVVGVFAIAEGTAFGGATVNLFTEPDITELVLRLGSPGKVEGMVSDFKKRPVEGARITRIGLLGPSKVGLPMAKLRALGFVEPATDASGRFAIEHMPEGSPIAIKVAHPDFAQEAVEQIMTGDQSVRVSLIPGILVQGKVVLRDAKRPVADVPVILRNAQPPHDTAIMRTNGSGEFAVRLKPGAYLYQAVGGGYRNAGWERLPVTGAEPQMNITIYAAGAGVIRGKVCDAVSGLPIPRARIALETQGNLASLARTAADGGFSISAMEGENVLRIESAPGYLPPEQPALRLNVVAGKETLLPSFWLAPIPAWTVEILDSEGHPVPGAVVSMVRPEQQGWYVTDTQGRALVRFASLPPEGPLLGLVEDTKSDKGAFFAIARDSKGPARVQLLPLATVRGRVVAENRTPVAGVTVSATFGKEGCRLWRSATDSAGCYRWPSVVPGVPQYVTVDGAAGNSAAPLNLLAEPEKDVELGDLVVSSSPARASLFGEKLAWHEGRLIAGALPEAGQRERSVVVVCCCEAAGAAAALEGLAAAQSVFPGKEVLFVLRVDGPFSPADAAIPIVAGKNPGHASTYVLRPDGTVCLETFGMPPLRALREAMAPFREK
ncbi:MAG TPA: hypothetical protein PKO36_10120 [Candidatus Hydrogenedentes bacterium]|nr:hypothetical protein [Candidatus Hydrogenedentota bacterium]